MQWPPREAVLRKGEQSHCRCADAEETEFLGVEFGGGLDFGHGIAEGHDAGTGRDAEDPGVEVGGALGIGHGDEVAQRNGEGEHHRQADGQRESAAGDAHAALQFGSVGSGGHEDRLHIAEEAIGEPQGRQARGRDRTGAETHHGHRLADDRSGQVVDAGLDDQPGNAEIGDEDEK